MEGRISTLEAHDEELHRRLGEVQDGLSEIKEDLSELKQIQAKQKGFVAGAMFVITPIWVFGVGIIKGIADRYMGGDIG